MMSHFCLTCRMQKDIYLELPGELINRFCHPARCLVVGEVFKKIQLSNGGDQVTKNIDFLN